MIRAATPADVPAIARMWCDGWHDGHSGIVPPALEAVRTIDSFTERTAQKIPDTRVIMDGDTLLAMHMIQDDELYQVYVAAVARGTGTAQRLMADAEQVFQSRNITHPWLACSIGNDRAAQFYVKCGWTKIGTQDVSVETSMGPFPLAIWRFEKTLL